MNVQDFLIIRIIRISATPRISGRAALAILRNGVLAIFLDVKRTIASFHGADFIYFLVYKYHAEI